MKRLKVNNKVQSLRKRGVSLSLSQSHSSVFTSDRQPVPPLHGWFPVFPQSGNVSSVFGFVVALHEELMDTEKRRKTLRLPALKS